MEEVEGSVDSGSATVVAWLLAVTVTVAAVSLEVEVALGSNERPPPPTMSVWPSPAPAGATTSRPPTDDGDAALPLAAAPPVLMLGGSISLDSTSDAAAAVGAVPTLGVAGAGAEDSGAAAAVAPPGVGGAAVAREPCEILEMEDLKRAAATVERTSARKRRRASLN